MAPWEDSEKSMGQRMCRYSMRNRTCKSSTKNGSGVLIAISILVIGVVVASVAHA